MMTKLYFEDLNGKQEWVDLDFVKNVKLFKREEFCRIEFWDHDDGILGYFKINFETMKAVSEKIDKYFNGKDCQWFVDKAIHKNKKPEKALIQFPDISGVIQEIPAEDFKHLSCPTDDSGDRKFFVKFKNYAPLRIDKQTYDAFEEYIYLKNTFTFMKED